MFRLVLLMFVAFSFADELNDVADQGNVTLKGLIEDPDWEMKTNDSAYTKNIENLQNFQTDTPSLDNVTLTGLADDPVFRLASNESVNPGEIDDLEINETETPSMDQDNVTLTELADDPVLELASNDSVYPGDIEVLEMIDPETPSMYDDLADQGNVLLTALADNPYLELKTNEDSYPDEIEYLQDIQPDTPLMVRIILGDEDDSLDPLNTENSLLNICESLDRELDDPASWQKRYAMASSLGLEGQRCPIEKGIKSLIPYNYSTTSMSKDLGCGKKYYVMRIETTDPILQNVSIMELRVTVNSTNANETCIENSSSVPSLFSITASIIVVLYVVKFIN